MSVIYHVKYNHLDSVFDTILVPILCASRAQFVMFFLFLHIFLPPSWFLPRYPNVNTNVRTDCDGALKNVFWSACFEVHIVQSSFLQFLFIYKQKKRLIMHSNLSIWVFLTFRKILPGFVWNIICIEKYLYYILRSNYSSYHTVNSAPPKIFEGA